MDIISHNCCPWPKGVSWPCPEVISLRSRSECMYIQNLCPLDQGHTLYLIIFKAKVTVHTYQKSVSGPNSSLPCWIRIIFHTIVFHYPRVCHDLHQMVILMYILGQGHSAHIPENRFQGHNSLLSSWILIILHTIVVHDPRGCHDLDPRSYLQVEGHSTHITKIPCHTYNHG